jgi:HPt (histidine-containing phosphotransfer) domain-containing protein
MPKMDSLVLTTMLREPERSIGTQLPVIALTALDIKSAPMVPDDAVEAAQLLDRIDDDRGFLAELVEVFRREYPYNVETAQKAIDAQRPADLERAAHRLRGALGNLSAQNASTLAAELESVGRSADLTGAQTILNTLVPELGKVMRALEALCRVVA